MKSKAAKTTKKIITKTKIQDLPKREQKILKDWLSVVKQIEDTMEILEELKKKESKLAEKAIVVLKKVDEQAVKVSEVTITLVQYRQMISRPKYKELYEKALPYLSEKLRRKLEKLREEMIQYKVVEKPKIVKGSIISKAREKIKHLLKKITETLKGLIAWIGSARSYVDYALEAIAEAKAKASKVEGSLLSREYIDKLDSLIKSIAGDLYAKYGEKVPKTAVKKAIEDKDIRKTLENLLMEALKEEYSTSVVKAEIQADFDWEHLADIISLYFNQKDDYTIVGQKGGLLLIDPEDWETVDKYIRKDKIEDVYWKIRDKVENDEEALALAIYCVLGKRWDLEPVKPLPGLKKLQ